MDWWNPAVFAHSPTTNSFLTNVKVAKRVRGCGYGRKLAVCLVGQAVRAGRPHVEIVAQNAKARRFWTAVLPGLKAARGVKSITVRDDMAGTARGPLPCKNDS